MVIVKQKMRERVIYCTVYLLEVIKKIIPFYYNVILVYAINARYKCQWNVRMVQGPAMGIQYAHI